MRYFSQDFLNGVIESLRKCSIALNSWSRQQLRNSEHAIKEKTDCLKKLRMMKASIMLRRLRGYNENLVI